MHIPRLTCILCAAGAAALETIYFEDSGLRPALINCAVRKKLWVFAQAQHAALRSHIRTCRRADRAAAAPNAAACPVPRGTLADLATVEGPFGGPFGGSLCEDGGSVSGDEGSESSFDDSFGVAAEIGGSSRRGGALGRLRRLCGFARRGLRRTGVRVPRIVLFAAANALVIELS